VVRLEWTKTKMAHSPEKKAAVVSDLICGMTQREAARRHGVSAGTVKDWAIELETTQEPRKTTQPIPVLARREQFALLLYDFLESAVRMADAWTKVCSEPEFIKSNASDVNNLGRTALDFADRIVARTATQRTQDAPSSDSSN